MVTNDAATRTRIASGINVSLGALLITLPWLLQYTPWEIDLTRNSIIVGGLILICASIRIAHPRSSIAFSVANMALGFWTLLSSSLFADAAAISGWLSLVVGAAVMTSAAWSANNVTDGSAHSRHA